MTAVIIAMGLAPLLHASPANTQEALRGRTAEVRGRRTRSILVVAEAARTDSKVIHTTLHSVANVRGRTRRQAVAHFNEISTRHNEQSVPGNL
jgi:hypothetical protein